MKASGKRIWKHDNSADMKVEIEAFDLLMDPADSEVCLRCILTHAIRRGSRIFEIFSTKEDSEELKVGLSELKEQLEMPEETCFTIMQIAEQARKEGDPKLFEIFRQGENVVYIASLARWDTQLKGLVEMERHCQDLTQEVHLSGERQEVLVGMVVSKRDMQKEAPKKYQEKIFEEFKEFLGAKGQHMLTKWEGEREKARMVQSLGESRAIKYLNGARGNVSVEMCSCLLWHVTGKKCARILRGRCRTRTRPRLRLRGLPVTKG